MTPFQEDQKLIRELRAEIERLSALNAELVAALSRYKDALAISELARDRAIAKAEGK